MRRSTTQRLLVALTALAAVTVGALYLSSAPAAAASDCSPVAGWGTSRGDYAARVVTLVNAHRQALGLGALQVSASLEDAAEWKVLHMANYGYMAHEDPAPPIARSTQARLVSCGYPGTGVGWAENIAYGYASPEAVVNAWLTSPGHRANIEKPSYRTIGVGAAVKGSGPLYWAQAFGTWTGDAGTGPGAPVATPPPTPSVTPTVTVVPKPAATPRPPRNRGRR